MVEFSKICQLFKALRAEDHLILPSNFCHKIFQHRSTIRHLPDYKIVKQKFLTIQK